MAALTERQQRIADWVRGNGDVTSGEILVGIGERDMPEARSALSGTLRALCVAGLITRHKIGRRNVKYTAGSNAALKVGGHRTCVIDPWGQEITEEDARRVMADATRCYLERPSVRKNPQQFARTAFILGAYMTGRPLPAQAPAVASAAAITVSQTAASSSPRKALPAGWDEDELARRLREAERKGRVTYAELAHAVGYSEDYFRNVGAGGQYMTADVAERVYAVIEGRLS